MKTKLLSLLAASASLVLGAASAPAANVSVEVFYNSLEPYGEWIDTSDYGYVWHPRDVDESWRPYTVGNWAYTDVGWTWVSEEPFGWATYHYGRWVELDRVGWTWVPDREWGPAWVSWRRSDSHVGWAPLPPEARFEAQVGFSGWVDSYYDIGPTYYSFVKVRDFGAPRLRTVILEPRENITIIRETRNITNITYVNNVIMNQGPDYDVVVRESARPIRRLKLDRRTDIDYRSGDRDRFNAQVSGETLRVAAPEVELSREVAPRQVARKMERVSVNRGWRDAGEPQAVEKLRTQLATEAKVPEGMPPSPTRRGEGERRTTTREGATETRTPTSAETKAPEMKRGTEAPAATTAEGRRGRPGATPAPGATETATPRTPATAETATPDMKRGGERTPGAATPTGRDRRGTTAETTKPGATETPTARTEKPASTPPATERSRRGANAETAKPGSRTPAAAEAAKAAPRGQDDKPPTAESRGADSKRPDATPRERQTTRPESRGSSEADAARREAAKKESASPESSTPGRSGPRPESQRPPTDRPSRPEASAERPDRAERKAPPAAQERGDAPKAPEARENRSPDRGRPEGAARSPENQPPSPGARGAERAPRGAEKAAAGQPAGANEATAQEKSEKDKKKD